MRAPMHHNIIRDNVFCNVVETLILRYARKDN